MNKTNTQSIVSNTIEYTGIVTLSQCISGKKFEVAKMHNAGGHALFDFLADCLIGDFEIAKLDRPVKILLLNEDDNHNITRANDTGFIYLTAKPEKIYSDTEGIVRYSFTLPQDLFTGTNFNAVGLYTNTATIADVEDYAAYCYIGADTLANTSISSILVLDWELHISN